MSSMARRFSASRTDSRFAMSTTSDSSSVSMIFMPCARRVEPVSDTSTMASTISGTFASVAPYDSNTLTGTPTASKCRRTRLGYSVEMREPGARSAALSAGFDSGTASTMRTPYPTPPLAYSSDASSSTAASVSCTQSRPVIPMSKNPSST